MSKWLVRLFTDEPGQLMILPWKYELTGRLLEGVKQWEVEALNPWQAAVVASALAYAEQDAQKPKEPDPLWSVYLDDAGNLIRQAVWCEDQRGSERRCSLCKDVWHEFVRALNPEQAASVARGHQIAAGATQKNAPEQAVGGESRICECGHAKRTHFFESRCSRPDCECKRFVWVFASVPGDEPLNTQSLNACSNEKQGCPSYAVPPQCQPEREPSVRPWGSALKFASAVESFVQCFSTALQSRAEHTSRAILPRVFSDHRR